MPAKEKVQRKSYLLPVLLLSCDLLGPPRRSPRTLAQAESQLHYLSGISLSASPYRKRWKVRNRYKENWAEPNFLRRPPKPTCCNNSYINSRASRTLIVNEITNSL